MVRSTLSVVLALVLPAAAQAQAGRISGTVTDSLNRPLATVTVSVVGLGVSATTSEGGRFAITGVRPGSYDVEGRRIGHRPTTVRGVTVRPGEETVVNIRLVAVPLELTQLVVSASRRPEKVTDAPATLTRIDVAGIENTVGNSASGALKAVVGLDFIQVGVTAVAVNARGFNSSFNNRMLMMEDNRVAVLPENGLPVGAFTTVPKVDLAAIEVLVGPGSALYGPDASNGVITTSTRDPRDFPGSTIEVSGGSRNFIDVQGRHAGVLGRFGYKVYGEYQRADDWENQLIYAPISATAPPSPELGASFNTNVARGGAALVYYLPNAMRFELTGGLSQSDGIGQTNVGRNQLVNWQYRNLQLKFSNPHFFAQAYTTQSRSGQTYQLNGFAQNRLRFPTLTDDSVKYLSDFPAEGDLVAGEVQTNFTVRALRHARITLGVQARHDRVSSQRQWLSDRQSGEDITVDQTGGYAQVELPVSSWLRVVGAGRYDDHSNYDGQFSPKAAVLVTPLRDQTFRVTYNRAFKSPTVLQTSFFFPDFSPAVGVFGNRDGFVIRDGSNNVVRTIDPIEPEINNTFELGYKGILGGRLYLEATAYHSRFEHFMSPLVVIANFTTPAASGGPTFAFNAVTGAAITGATGGPQIPLTYYNVGSARVHGFDVGGRFLLRPTLALTGTMSWQRLDTVYARTGDPAEATMFNSPMLKATTGVELTSMFGRPLGGSLLVRGVDGYQFRSGVNTGYIPGFVTADLNFGYDLPRYHARVNLSVQNLFTCVSGTTAANGWIASGRAQILTAGNTCGFDRRHIEMLNTPEIGTMAFLGIRFNL